MHALILGLLRGLGYKLLDGQLWEQVAQATLPLQQQLGNPLL